MIRPLGVEAQAVDLADESADLVETEVPTEAVETEAPTEALNLKHQLRPPNPKHQLRPPNPTRPSLLTLLKLLQAKKDRMDAFATAWR